MAVPAQDRVSCLAPSLRLEKERFVFTMNQSRIKMSRLSAVRGQDFSEIRGTYMIRFAVPIALAAALCLGNWTAAVHAEDRGTKEQQDACTPDVYRLCTTEIPDTRKIVSCLRANRDKLSPACRKVFS
jgi:hypothetical protein